MVDRVVKISSLKKLEEVWKTETENDNELVRRIEDIRKKIDEPALDRHVEIIISKIITRQHCALSLQDLMLSEGYGLNVEEANNG